MKKKLLILSDIHGSDKALWIETYYKLLEDTFEISVTDILTLANINRKDKPTEVLHTELIKGGIDRAVHQLIYQKDETRAIVGFSICGLIAWQASLNGLMPESLVLVSSTRLRYETQKPACKLFLIYGAEDKFRPDDKWFASQNLNGMLIENQGHEFYRKKEFIQLVVEKIKENI